MLALDARVDNTDRESFQKAIRALEQKQTNLLKDQNCKLNKLFSIRKQIQGILSLQSNTSDVSVDTILFS